MAIVLTRQYGDITVHIADDYYINCTQAEKIARRKHLDSVVRKILSVPENLERLIEMYKKQDGDAT